MKQIDNRNLKRSSQTTCGKDFHYQCRQLLVQDLITLFAEALY